MEFISERSGLSWEGIGRGFTQHSPQPLAMAPRSLPSCPAPASLPAPSVALCPGAWDWALLACGMAACAGGGAAFTEIPFLFSPCSFGALDISGKGVRLLRVGHRLTHF